MENDNEQIEQLSKALTSMDEWLVKFGYISNHAHNRVLEQLAVDLNFNMGDIEYLVDTENRRIELTLYVSIWYLIYLILFFKRDKMLREAIAIVEGILHGYEIRAVITRRGRRDKNKKLINERLYSGDDDSESDEIESGISSPNTEENLQSNSEQQTEHQPEVREEVDSGDSQSKRETQDTS